MITREDVLKLAALSRLKLSDDEVLKMQSDMTAILSYIDILKAAHGSHHGPVMTRNKNVMREDGNGHESGMYTDALMNLAPKSEKTSEGGYLKVKRILGSSQ